MTTHNSLSPRSGEALQYAFDLHRTQTMKGGTIPYMAHILGVASITMLYGGDEEAAIVALLHDSIEDTDATSEEVEHRFGPDIARDVASLSDADVPAGHTKPPWSERKVEHLQKLEGASSRALLVYAADKLQNARAILKDYRIHSEMLWERFNGRRTGTLWYYERCLALFRIHDVNPELVDEIDRTLAELKRLLPPLKQGETGR